MKYSQRKIVVAVSGASGAIYAQRLFYHLHKILAAGKLSDVAVVMTTNAREVWDYELKNAALENYPFSFYEADNFYAPFASGSSTYDSLIICPCSMGMLARIANGIAGELISRAADVMLKERRSLVLVTRETPLNSIHLSNMQSVTQAGGIICPASPSFYKYPETIEDLIDTVIFRVLDLIKLPLDNCRWGE